MRSHHIALWDVLASCEIQGAADASIRRPVANDLRPIFETAPIRAVLTTGKKGDAALPPILPSANRDGQRLFALPSAANCRGCTLESPIQSYAVIKQYVDD